MLKRYEVKYNVGLNSDVRTQICVLDETQSEHDFCLMLAIQEFGNVRDDSLCLINIISDKFLSSF